MTDGEALEELHPAEVNGIRAAAERQQAGQGADEQNESEADWRREGLQP